MVAGRFESSAGETPRTLRASRTVELPWREFHGNCSDPHECRGRGTEGPRRRFGGRASEVLSLLLTLFLTLAFERALQKKRFFAPFAKKRCALPWLRHRFASLAKRCREHGPESGHRRRRANQCPPVGKYRKATREPVPPLAGAGGGPLETARLRDFSRVCDGGIPLTPPAEPSSPGRGESMKNRVTFRRDTVFLSPFP
ncbi:hypothetical protein SIID45300_03177 [Candidatus Magnetaquicoccaceae bacterium FCR-1]|uniref:Secreted protein n=1 Tax=Candidatus Magnetaquiglobus chichijimensis TaxID=3141448 RepID=A0ABQ0CDP4_9PROT